MQDNNLPVDFYENYILTNFPVHKSFQDFCSPLL